MLGDKIVELRREEEIALRKKLDKFQSDIQEITDEFCLKLLLLVKENEEDVFYNS